MTRTIPVTFIYPVLAMNPTEAARALSISRRKLWHLIAVGDLHKTKYGRIPVSEIERHLAQEVER